MSHLKHTELGEFIASVREMRELYEENSSDERKMELWEGIAKAFGISLTSAMQQWAEVVRLHHNMYPELPAEAFRVQPNESEDMEDPRWQAANLANAMSLSHFFQSELDFLFVD